MKKGFRLSEFGKTISLSQAISYLGSTGWKIHTNEIPIRCEGPTDDAGGPIVAFIPSNDALRDFPLRLEDLILLLSDLEERPAIMVANDMASVHPRDESIPPTLLGFVDILKLHVRSRQTERVGEQYSRTLVSLAENVELSIGGGNTTMAAALLLATCAKMHTEFEEPRLLLWRLVEWAGIFLKNPTPAKLDELYQLAVHAAPDLCELLDWLNANEEDADRAKAERAKTVEGFRRSSD